MTIEEIVAQLEVIKTELLRKLDAEKRKPEEKRLGRVAQIARPREKAT